MTTPRPYPAACRECTKSEGWPVRAQTVVQLTAIRVDVRCRACGHQWTEDLMDPKPLEIPLAGIGEPCIRRKPERRKGTGRAGRV